MSKLRIRLFGLSVVLLSLISLGAVPAANACIDVIAYGTNPATGECREFPNPCSVPKGWTINYTGCPQSSVSAFGAMPVASRPACIDVIAYGTNPATGECRQFPNPCSVPAGWTISYTGCAI
jgi:hypothetical protein